LHEIHSPQLSLSKSSQKQPRDWLNLAAREVLGTLDLPCAVALMDKSYIVDLKYITSRQVIGLSYEGITRQFIIHSIRPRDPEEHSQSKDLSQSIGALSISSQPVQLWKVDWDCVVSILEDRIVYERSSLVSSTNKN
jgi:AAA family ATPase